MACSTQGFRGSSLHRRRALTQRDGTLAWSTSVRRRVVSKSSTRKVCYSKIGRRKGHRNSRRHRRCACSLRTAHWYGQQQYDVVWLARVEQERKRRQTLERDRFSPKPLSSIALRGVSLSLAQTREMAACVATSFSPDAACHPYA
jgi:hypothetical protein